jgi:hypothetical protein
MEDLSTGRWLASVSRKAERGWLGFVRSTYVPTLSFLVSRKRSILNCHTFAFIQITGNMLRLAKFTAINTPNAPPFIDHSAFAVHVPNGLDACSSFLLANGSFGVGVGESGKFQSMLYSDLVKNVKSSSRWRTNPLMGVYNIEGGHMQPVNYAGWERLQVKRLKDHVFLMYPEAAGMESGLRWTNADEKATEWKRASAHTPLAVAFHVVGHEVQPREWYKVEHLQDPGSYQLVHPDVASTSYKRNMQQEELMQLAIEGKYQTCEYKRRW